MPTAIVSGEHALHSHNCSGPWYLTHRFLESCITILWSLVGELLCWSLISELSYFLSKRVHVSRRSFSSLDNNCRIWDEETSCLRWRHARTVLLIMTYVRTSNQMKSNQNWGPLRHTCFIRTWYVEAKTLIKTLAWCLLSREPITMRC